MDVQCPQCDTLYEIDARQLRGGAATFKCSHCQHVFRLKTHASLTREDERRWMVRDAESGDVLYFDAFDKLHAWIIEGRVGARDAISRTGDRWTRLGDIGEFRPIFQAAESTSEIGSSGAVKRRTTRPGLGEVSRPEASHTPARRQRSATQPGESTPDKTSAPDENNPNVRLQTGAFGSAGAPEDEPEGDGWSFGESSTLGEIEGVDAQPQPAPASDGGRGVLIATLVVLLLGGAATGLYFGQPGLLDGFVASVPGDSSEEGTDDEADDEPSGAPHEASADVIAEAVKAADRAHREPIAESREAASEAIGKGVASAGEKAREEGEEREEEQDEPSPRELLASGERALEQGSTAKARSQFERVLDAESNNAAAINGLGWAYLTEGRDGAAVEQFERALQADSSLGDAYIGLGKAERERGDDAAALKAYKTYLERFPDGSKSSIAEYQVEQLE